MTLANFASYVYRRTKSTSANWDSSGADLVIALNNANEYAHNIIRDMTDNYAPTAWTTGDLSTGTATPVFDANFHEIVPLRICLQYAIENERKNAQSFSVELANMEDKFVRFYGARNYRIFTVTIATPGVFLRKDHGLTTGDRVILSTSGALPSGLTANTWYYVVSGGLDDDNFELSATRDGTAITTSGSQSGTHWYASDIPKRMGSPNAPFGNRSGFIRSTYSDSTR